MDTAKQITRHDEQGHYRWAILAAAVVAQMTAAVATQGIGVLAGFIQDDLHLSNADVGILAGVLNVAPILGLLVVGQWLDRATVRFVIGIGAAVMGIAMAWIGWVSTFGVLLLCLFWVGAGYSTAQPGGSKAVFQWFSARERGLAMGIRQAGLPLGGAMAAAIFPVIADMLGWRMAFLAGAVITVLGSTLLCVLYRDPMPASEVLQEPQEQPHPLNHMRSLLGMAEFRQVALSGVTLVAVQTVALMFLLLYLRERFGIALVSGALYLFAMQLAGAMGRVLLAAWSDRVRHGRAGIVMMAIVGSLLGVLALGMFPAGADHGLLIVVVVWLGFFSFGWYGPWVAWVSEVGPKKHVGATLGLAMALNQVAIVLAPIVFGVLLDSTTSYFVPGAALVAALTGCIIYFGAKRLSG